MILIIGLVFLVARWLSRQTSTQTGASKTTSSTAAFAGSASCRDCHAQEFNDWKNSHHALAEREISTVTDEKAFVPAHQVKVATQVTAFQKKGNSYQLITAGLRGSNEAFEVSRILAESPLRQMLIPFPGGRLQATELAWDPLANQWFDVFGHEDRKPGEWGHWTGRGMNWNSMCAACHNTAPHKNYDAPTDSYHTTLVEHGVGCESCHGSMLKHNEWQTQHKGTTQKDPTLQKLSRNQSMETCATCHSRRGELSDRFQPGDSYWDHYQLSIVDDSDTFYPDGQIRDEDYEYTAFLGSAMHNHGVSCSDCHNPHTMKTKLPGNFLCLSCHAVGMTNAPNIDPVRHSHHPVYGYDASGVLTNFSLTSYQPSPSQVGGECVNCHMPQTVYMQRHSRHDHGFTIPDPLLTKNHGIPNACERCHADKGTDWNLRNVEHWYETNMNRPYRQRAEILARARQGDASVIQPLLNMLSKDKIPYWQAVAAGMLQKWSGDTHITSALTDALTNTNALVRQMAVRALGSVSEQGRTEPLAALEPMLKDKSRNVRIEAAHLFLAKLDTNSRAGQDYLEMLGLSADQPVGQMQAGEFALAKGDATNALVCYMTAVKWDPGSPGLRNTLAVILSQLGRPTEAVVQMEEAVKLAPQNADFHYALALALNEVGKSEQVEPELELAVKFAPQFAPAWYNLGLARSSRGNDSGALEALIRAESADPNDPRIPYARATVLARLGRTEEARTCAHRALEIKPNFSPAAQLLRQLQ